VSVTFLIKRGKAAVQFKARAHIARYNAHGQFVGAWCPYRGYDLSSNVPWGLRQCRHCVRAYMRAEASS
jgi:hypothetical protein